jgi:hypothetical protein
VLSGLAAFAALCALTVLNAVFKQPNGRIAGVNKLAIVVCVAGVSSGFHVVDLQSTKLLEFRKAEVSDWWLNRAVLPQLFCLTARADRESRQPFHTTSTKLRK